MNKKHSFFKAMPLILLICMLFSVTAFAAVTNMADISWSWWSTAENVRKSGTISNGATIATVNPGDEINLTIDPLADYRNSLSSNSCFTFDIYQTDTISNYNLSTSVTSEYVSYSIKNRGTSSEYYTYDYKIKVDEHTTQDYAYIQLMAKPLNSTYSQIIKQFRININTVVKSIDINPKGTVTAEVGGTYKFTTSVDGGGKGYSGINWLITGKTSNNTSFSGNTLTIGADETASSIKVQAISKVDNSVVSDQVTVNIQKASKVVSVKIDADSNLVVMEPGTAKTFTATVETTGSATKDVTWSITGQKSSSTAINASTGKLKIGADETSTLITVVAKSTYDSSKNNAVSVHAYHDWDEVNRTNSTCITAGAVEYYCEICDDTKYVGLPLGGHTTTKKVTKGTFSADGKVVEICKYCKETIKTTVYPQIGTVALSSSTVAYNGKVRTPSVVVKDKNGNAISSKYYTVTTPEGRKNVGAYTYTVTFKTRYSGTKNLVFTIEPTATSITALTALSQGFKVTWTPIINSQIEGYEIQFSSSSSYSSSKTVTITSNSTSAKKITGRSANKKYYVRIRTYKNVNGTKYVSSWSKSQTVTTKP